MAKMRVYELAKELNRSHKEILNLLEEYGMPASNHMSTVDENAAEFVIRRIRNGAGGRPAVGGAQEGLGSLPRGSSLGDLGSRNSRGLEERKDGMVRRDSSFDGGNRRGGRLRQSDVMPAAKPAVRFDKPTLENGKIIQFDTTTYFDSRSSSGGMRVVYTSKGKSGSKPECKPKQVAETAVTPKSIDASRPADSAQDGAKSAASEVHGPETRATERTGESLRAAELVAPANEQSSRPVGVEPPKSPADHAAQRGEAVGTAQAGAPKAQNASDRDAQAVKAPSGESNMRTTAQPAPGDRGTGSTPVSISDAEAAAGKQAGGASQSGAALGTAPSASPSSGESRVDASRTGASDGPYPQPSGFRGDRSGRAETGSRGDATANTGVSPRSDLGARRGANARGDQRRLDQGSRRPTGSRAGLGATGMVDTDRAPMRWPAGRDAGDRTERSDSSTGTRPPSRAQGMSDSDGGRFGDRQFARTGPSRDNRPERAGMDRGDRSARPDRFAGRPGGPGGGPQRSDDSRGAGGRPGGRSFGPRRSGLSIPKPPQELAKPQESTRGPMRRSTRKDRLYSDADEGRDRRMSARSETRRIRVQDIDLSTDDIDYGIHNERVVYKAKPRTTPKSNTRERVVKVKTIDLPDEITVRDFALRLEVSASDVIRKLMKMGVMASINETIDFDTCEVVADEYGFKANRLSDIEAAEVTVAEVEDAPESLRPRPPVVTILGHVDHGKTSLLDAIRSTHVTATEAGGITQHIGAYQVELNGRKITFIDTPGHEAFTAMRARGAQVTDVAILVVAADDGVMPQTVEAINHAKSADVPIIVALNKVDKPEAQPERVKQQLTEYGLVSEEWGGDTICVNVSAITKQGLDQLLEMILLVADVKELKANPDRPAKGYVIEARLDKGRGPVATVLVQTGTLRIGDSVIAGGAYGRVRAMTNDRGESLEEAPPSTPVEITGFGDVPEAGDVLNAVEEDKLARLVASKRQERRRSEELKESQKVTLDDFYRRMKEGKVKELAIIVKGDVQGSVEAICQSLERLGTDEVKVKVVHSGVGAITETDVMLASASNAIIIGFNVRPDAIAKVAAERENVDVRMYRIIYEAMDDVKKALSGLLTPEIREKVIGHAEVRATFKIPKVGTIGGCYVTDGKITRSANIRVLRDNVVIFEGKIESLKRFKDDAKEVAEGFECGIGIERFNDIKEGDVIEAFVKESVDRTL